jgi:hypothetical protein
MKLADVRRIALSLREVTEEPHFAYTSFRVKGKIFATAPPGNEYLHIFVADEDREPVIALHPEFLEKLLWGEKVRGLRVILASAKSSVVSELLRLAWARKAPKHLLQARPLR